MTYPMLCPECGGTPADTCTGCTTCGRRDTNPQLRPARWWRDDETRYLTRAEYSDMKRRPHFNLSEIPRGDNPELDAFVEKWRDEHGFVRPEFVMPPMEFERLEPMDPIADIKANFPPVKPFFALGELVGVRDELYDDDEYREDDE